MDNMKRPYSTHYYHSPADKMAAHTSQGAAASEEGAIRATVVRVFIGQYKKAVIHDRRTGVALYHIFIERGCIKVRYGSGVPFKRYEEVTES